MKNKLNEQRKSVKQEMETILAGAVEGILSEEQTVAFDTAKAQYEKLGASIERINTVEEINKQNEVKAPKAGKLQIAAPAIRIHKSKAISAFENNDHAYRAGLWLASVVRPNDKRIQRMYETECATTMVEGTDNIGGATVPDEFSNVLLKLMKQYGVGAAHARVINMTSDVMTVPQNAGGISVTDESEAGSIDEQNATWAKVTLTATKKAALTRISGELFADSFIDLANDVFQDHATAHASKQDTETFAGTAGVQTKINTSSGSTYAASIVAAAATHLAFSDFDIADFISVFGKLPEFAGANPAWYISKPGYAASMARLQLAAGGNSVTDFGTGPVLSFMGYPVYLVEALNSTLTDQASTIKVLFGDLKLACAIGLRQDVTFATSTEHYFSTDEVALRSVSRWGLNVHSLGSSSVVGPMIALKTPAS